MKEQENYLVLKKERIKANLIKASLEHYYTENLCGNTSLFNVAKLSEYFKELFSFEIRIIPFPTENSEDIHCKFFYDERIEAIELDFHIKNNKL